MESIKIDLSNTAIAIKLRFPESAVYFADFMCWNTQLSVPEVELTQQDWDGIKDLNLAICAHTEYSILTANCSDVLLPFDRVIIHAVALRWHDKAYLICANSGVGKSTQARFLQQLRPDEFGIICGDRPILEFRHSDSDKGDTITVWPSPWNGKENWHGAEAAPLAGIILLERGEENKLCALSEKETILPMYTYFIHTGWKAENIKKIADLETRLLRNTQLWKLVTNTVPDSTKLLLESVFPQ